ncbi:PKD domain-containing protein [Modestobacter sp. L9-4]|uniref:PKD domain-containing protein n=1 Tax=Modestobacter sp. L9-4 TaxID=2851567 RepID=UPI001C780B6F|nr:PKD domain-containing protein [Modestobacter sp. L9-4]QXG74975.1 PKD domain-containing protein [Modestobacter sp. L9-4]
MSARVTSSSRPLVAGVLSALLFIGVLAGGLVPTAARADTAPAPVTPTNPTTVTADPLPTVQVNGVVWSQVVVGNRVYVAGEFTSARPAGAAAGTQETPRGNLLAYDLTTGALISSWAPSLNAQALVLAASPDGSRLYVGGDFNQVTVNGTATRRNRVAAFDTASGQLVSSFNPNVTGQVRAIAATNSTVYLGGKLTAVGGTARTALAAVTSAGALLPWAPVPGVGPTSGNRLPYTAGQENPNLKTTNAVMSLLVTRGGSQVVVAGRFYTLNNTVSSGVGALDATSGATLPFQMGQIITNQGVNSAVYSLSTDGTNVYGTAYDFYGPGNLEGSFAANPDGGAPVWINDCHGDSYSSAPLNGALYQAGHPHDCSLIGGYPEQNPRVSRYATALSLTPAGTVSDGADAALRGRPSPALLHWYPDTTPGSYTGSDQSGWSVAGSGNYLLYGGEFTKIGGVAQQGLVRFAMPQVAPRKVAPNGNDQLTPSVVSQTAGTARVSWQATFDQDNRDLVYRVYRSDRPTTPVYEVGAPSAWWDRPSLGFVDTGLTPGATYGYKVTAVDPDGNTRSRGTTTVTVSSAATAAYPSAVLADAPSGYWRLGEPTGTTQYDRAGFADITPGAGLSATTPGAVRNDADGALRVDGAAKDATGAMTGRASAGLAAQAAPQTFSLELWFQTTSTAGGRLAGFGNSRTGENSSYDRQLYLDTAGKLSFGVYPGTTRIVTSPTALNDGRWHHVVAELGGGNQVLYVDGLKVAAATGVAGGQDYSGWWQVGGNNLNGWATNGYYTGNLDEVAVYGTALTTAQVRAHYVAGGGSPAVNPRPADAYGARVYDDEPSLFWRLGETSGSTAANSADVGYPGTYTSTTLGQSGAPLAGVTDSRGISPASSGGYVTGTTQVMSPQVFSEELWFTSTSTKGGRLMGFGNARTGGSGTYDRAVYLLADGRLRFTTSNGTTRTADSTARFNDGQWHHVVASMGPAGMVLYADGAKVGSNAGATAAGSYNGYWRLGTDNLGDTASSPYFTGRLDEAAVYPVQLTDAQVAAHFAASRGTVDQRPTAAFTATATDLAVQFDAADSSDAEGPLADWRWTFGDGSTGTGVAPAHTYATAGTYAVQLTVTDRAGGTGTLTQQVTVTAPLPNQVPTAAFTATATGLTAQLDGGASTDPDGTVAAWDWAFGDGTTGTGATTSHTWPATGTYAVVLTVTDDDGATASTTRQVTVTAPNKAPTAAFTSTVSGLSAAFDSAGSADVDGQLVARAWDFGDGATSGVAAPSHTYAAAGTYAVKLTVTDDDGASATVTQSVTVSAGPASVVADRFERSVASGLGAAETGGTWTVSGGTAVSASVAGGVGQLVVSRAGQTATAALSSVSVADVAFQTTVVLPAAPTGGGTYVTLAARRVGADQYQVVAKFLADGRVTLTLNRVSGGVTTALKGVTVPGLTYVAGAKVNLLLDVAGSGTTTLQAAAWPAGQARPASQLTATDTTASLQAAGSLSVAGYVSGSSTALPVTVQLDDLWAGVAGASRPQDPTAPTVNKAPTAAFTSAVSGLSVSVDSAGSSDADGRVVARAWDFGDGATSGLAAPSHTYAAAGTYAVKLTVTDDAGATGSVTRSVTVSAGPPSVVADRFERSVASGLGSAETGGAWTVSGGTAVSASVGNGVGSLVVSRAGQTATAALSSVSVADVAFQTTVVLPAAPTGGGTYVTLAARRVGADQYQVVAKFLADGRVTLTLNRVSGGVTTALKGTTVAGLTYVAGAKVNLLLDVAGSGTTTLQAAAWPAGQPRPASQLSATDTTASLQAAGSLSVAGYVSGSSTALPVTVQLDDVSAGPAGSTPQG